MLDEVQGTALKQADLENCAICDQGLMHDGSFYFYRVSIEQMIINVPAVQRQHGLEQFFGQAAPLASVMGPNEDMAKGVGPKPMLICSHCALHERLPVAVLLVENEPDENQVEEG